MLSAVLLGAVLWRRDQPEDMALVQTADQLLAARAAGDIQAALSLFSEDATASSQEGRARQGRNAVWEVLSEWMLSDEAISAGPRMQVGADSVQWTESVVQQERPSWENNLNASLDGNEALWTHASATSTVRRYVRSVRLTAADGRIHALSIAEQSSAVTGPRVQLQLQLIEFSDYLPVLVLLGAATLPWTLFPRPRHARPRGGAQSGQLISGLKAYVAGSRARDGDLAGGGGA
jgi:hypothetical protein